jgi:hypothetical protein
MFNFNHQCPLYFGLLIGIFCCQPTFAKSCSGGSCSGGANFVGNETVDSYLQRHKQSSAQVEALVKDDLAQLRKLAPAFADELGKGVQELSWYVVDRPLLNLPFSRTELPFQTEQGAVQYFNPDAGVHVGNKVYFNDKQLKELKPRELHKAYLHELVRRLQLRGEATNVLLTPSSAFEATNLLSDAIEGKLNSIELAEKLNKIGYNTEGFLNPDPPKPTAADLKAVFRDPVEVQFDIKHPITLTQARRAVELCTLGANPAEPTEESLLGELALRYTDKSKIEPASPAKQEAQTYYHEHSKPYLYGHTYCTRYAGNIIREYTTKSGNNSTNHTQRETVANACLDNYEAAENPKFGVSGILGLIPIAAFPQFRLKPIDNERIFDDWGTTNKEMKLEKIAIFIEADQLAGKRLALRNRITRVVTPASLNTKLFVDCTKSKMEAISRQNSLIQEELSPAVNQGKSFKKATSEEPAASEMDKVINAK